MKQPALFHLAAIPARIDDGAGWLQHDAIVTPA
jgi:hypothetical protein